MRMRNGLFAVAVAVLLVVSAGAAAAQQGTSPWIHVELIEADEEGDGAKVNVNLPLSLLRVALEIASDEAFMDGHMDFDHADVTVEELRDMWQELRDSGDAEYVRVEEDSERVRVFREGETVFIHVDDLESGDEKVRIEVPFDIVDTLLEGEGHQLNLAGALDRIADTMRGDIVRVNDGGTTVRVWIDERD